MIMNIKFNILTKLLMPPKTKGILRRMGFNLCYKPIKLDNHYTSWD